MSKGAKKPSGQPEPKTLRDRVRAVVQAEVARAEPAETARRSLELIVETALRARDVDGDLQLTIVDDAGRTRTRADVGRSVPFTVADYVEELRRKHPTLFKARQTEPVPAPSAEAPTAAGPATASAARTIAEPAAAGVQRDWLDLGGSDRVPEPEIGKHPSSSAAKARFGAALRTGVATLAAARPLLTRSLGRFRDSIAVSTMRTAEPSPVTAPAVRPWRWLPAAGAIAGFAALFVGSALVVPRLMNLGDSPAQQVASRPPAPAPAPAPSPTEPTSTGTVAQNPTSATEPGLLRGLPEVLDTTTLRLQDRIVRLFGVEWARGGGDPDDLVKYLRGREVSCTPASRADSYRCQVDGQDLSRVVLFNGGGRATSDASPELRAAEEHARSARLGVWRDSRTASPSAEQ